MGQLTQVLTPESRSQQPSPASGFMSGFHCELTLISDQLTPEIATRSPTGPSLLPSFPVSLPSSCNPISGTSIKKQAGQRDEEEAEGISSKFHQPGRLKTFPAAPLPKTWGLVEKPPEGGRSLDSPLKPSERTADVAAMDTGPSEGRGVIFPN